MKNKKKQGKLINDRVEENSVRQTRNNAKALSATMTRSDEISSYLFC